MKSNNRNWLKLVEYASVSTSAVGAVAATIYQQAAFAAFPLTFTLGINLANRQRLERFTRRNQLGNEAAITNIQQTLGSLSDQVKALPPSTIKPLQENVAQLERSLTTVQGELAESKEFLVNVNKHLTSLPSLVYISHLEQVITNLQPDVTNIKKQLKNLPQPFDLSKTNRLEQEIEQLKATIAHLTQQFQQTEQRTEKVATQLRSELRTQIERILQLREEAPLPFDRKNLEKYLTTSGEQYRQIYTLYVKELFPVVKQLESELVPTRTALNWLKNQLETLELRFNNLLNIPEPIVFSKIEKNITGINQRLDSLTHQFAKRPELLEIQQLDERITLVFQQLGDLAASAKLINPTEVEELRKDVDKISQKLQIVSRLASEVGELKQQLRVLSKVNMLQQQLEDLEAKTLNLPDYNQQVMQEVQQWVEQLNEARTELDKHSQKLSQTSLQLEDIKQLTIGLEIKTTELDERTQNLSQLEQQLDNLQALVNQSVKSEDLDLYFTEVSQLIKDNIDVAVDQRIVSVNKQLQELQCQYEYKLVYDRKESRNYLLKAVQEAQERLILVCPWLNWGIHWNHDELIYYFEDFIVLKKGCIDIGWGHLTDMRKDEIKNLSGSKRRNKLKTSFARLYRALNLIEVLESKYPDNLKLKLLGTHEKYLVCDHSWAILGSHNFLSSASGGKGKPQERELGLWTNDQRIIAGLIQRFDNAKDIEQQSAKDLEQQSCEVAVVVSDNLDDVPF